MLRVPIVEVPLRKLTVPPLTAKLAPKALSLVRENVLAVKLNAVLVTLVHVPPVEEPPAAKLGVPLASDIVPPVFVKGTPTVAVPPLPMSVFHVPVLVFVTLGVAPPLL